MGSGDLERSSLENLLKSSFNSLTPTVSLSSVAEVKALADFVEEFNVGDLLVKEDAQWQWDKIRCIPDGGDPQKCVTLIEETPKATVRLACRKRWNYRDSDASNLQIDVIFKMPMHGVSRMIIGYDTDEDGNKDQALIEFYGGEDQKRVATVKLWNMTMPDQLHCVRWVTEKEPVDEVLEALVKNMLPNNAWDTAVIFLKMNADLLI